MTTRTETLPSAYEDPGGSTLLRLALGFLLTLLALAIFVLAFALAYTRMHEGRALPGVGVAGVSVGGLDAAQAEARLREELPDISAGALVVEVAGSRERIAYTDIGRDYDVELMVEQALSVGQHGDLITQAGNQLHILLNGVVIQPSLTWDSAELARRITAAAEAAVVEPVDAQVVRQGAIYVVEPAAAGQSIDVSRALELAHIALGDVAAREASIGLEAMTVAPAVTTEEAQAAVSAFERVTSEALAVSGGSMRATIGAEQLRGWTRLEEGSSQEWSLVIERDPAVQFAQTMALDIDQPAVDAGFVFEEGVVAAIAGQEGRVVDVEATADAIVAALEARSAGDGPTGVDVTMAVAQPDFTTEEAQALTARMERLSRWRTSYVPGSLNFRGANIRIPTDKIHGMVLEPGDTFDFWDVVGYPTEEEGYGPGAAIIRGRTVPDGALAGGICSCSTTIFNAALRAGLEMGSRRNHYYYINRYPVGLDATVWISNSGQRQTVRFTNDMEHPILIRGINRRSAVIFEIWGVPDGREVRLSRPTITNRRSAVEERRVSQNLRPGQSRRVEWPANGFHSTVTRTVLDAAGNVLHEDTYFSRYATINGVTLVGPSSPGPDPDPEPDPEPDPDP